MAFNNKRVHIITGALIFVVLQLLWLFFIYYNNIDTAINTFNPYQGATNFLPFNNYYQHHAKNSTKPKVLIVFGTRPEAIKMAPVISACMESKQFECITVSTGQHREMLLPLLKFFDIQIDIDLNLMKPNQDLVSLTVSALSTLTAVINEIKPQIVVVQGDTATSYAAALAAFFQLIPIAHIEAGLRSWNKYSPFPEEMNRQSISIISDLNFAATIGNAKNLLLERRNSSTIFLTGNPVVDSLHKFVQSTPSVRIQNLFDRLHQIFPSDSRKLILLTAHRRENHGEPLQRIMKAMIDILEERHDVVIVYPVHMNPMVRQSIQQVIPKILYEELINPDPQAPISQDILYRRLVLIDPLDYPDILHVMKNATIILTDSGGIQEEGVSMGKPILILRENTERPEGVEAGAAKLVGTSRELIKRATIELLTVPEVYNKMIVQKDLYGDGHSAKRIIDLLAWKLIHNNQSPPFPHVNLNHLLTPLTTASATDSLTISTLPLKKRFDLVIVLTVWKRQTLERILEMVKNQTVLSKYKTNILIFQNSNFTDVKPVIQNWKNKDMWGDLDVEFTYMQSEIPTGYYGRFLVPLLSDASDDAYFFVLDDDVIFGKEYFANSIRVVDSGYLATRNGRYVTKTRRKGILTENLGKARKGWKVGIQVTNENDIEYDFGGQIWNGKLGWLRLAWKHPPINLANCEDFWISAVLKVFYGIGTKRPKCPATNLEMCTCSMKIALRHVESDVQDVQNQSRKNIIRQIANHYGFLSFIYERNVSVLQNEAFQFYRQGPFQLEGTAFQDCLNFI